MTTFNSRVKLKGVIRSQSLLMVKLGFSLAVSAIFANRALAKSSSLTC